MIAQLSGQLAARNPDHLIVDVNGVGYRVFISLNTYYKMPEPGSRVKLLIHTVVRDDAIHLYGFLSQEDKDTFNILTGVSGVGPKLGLGILSGITTDELWLAVRSRDAARLTKVPGIGKKTANRLVLELEGKLPKTLEPKADDAGTPASPAAEDAVSAMMNLGYPEASARKTVEKAQAQAGPGTELEELLRLALKLI